MEKNERKKKVMWIGTAVTLFATIGIIFGTLYCFSETAQKYKGPGPKNAAEIAQQFYGILKATDPLQEIDRLSQLPDGYVFNWLNGKAESYRGTGRGLVLTTGDRYFRFAVHTIRAMRYLGCDLPVEVFYMGENDLSAANRAFFDQMPNVKTKDLFKYINNDKLQLKGWFAKPFSVLASSFSEVILFDADAVFLMNPEKFFNEEGYKTTGTFYYFDRISFWTPNKQFNTDLTLKRRFLDDLFGGDAPENIKNTRLYRGTSFHEQESGVVALDKSRHMLGLLMTCQISAPAEKVIVQVDSHGDKETFFLGSAIARLPYYFDSTVACNLGTDGTVSSSNSSVKNFPHGKLAHTDTNGNVFWFNNAIVDDRLNINSPTSKVTHVAFEGTWTSEGITSDKHRALTPDEQKKYDDIAALYSKDPVKETDPKQ